MTTKTKALLCAPVIALFLGGCTTMLEGKYPWREGWREAQITEIRRGPELSRPSYYYTCVRQTSPEQRAGQWYAVMKYRNFGSNYFHAMPVGSDHGLKVGDEVLARMGVCDGNIVKRGS